MPTPNTRPRAVPPAAPPAAAPPAMSEPANAGDKVAKKRSPQDSDEAKKEKKEQQAKQENEEYSKRQRGLDAGKSLGGGSTFAQEMAQGMQAFLDGIRLIRKEAKAMTGSELGILGAGLKTALGIGGEKKAADAPANDKPANNKPDAPTP